MPQILTYFIYFIFMFYTLTCHADTSQTFGNCSPIINNNKGNINFSFGGCGAFQTSVESDFFAGSRPGKSSFRKILQGFGEPDEFEEIQYFRTKKKNGPKYFLARYRLRNAEVRYLLKLRDTKLNPSFMEILASYITVENLVDERTASISTGASLPSIDLNVFYGGANPANKAEVTLGTDRMSDVMGNCSLSSEGGIDFNTNAFILCSSGVFHSSDWISVALTSSDATCDNQSNSSPGAALPSAFDILEYQNRMRRLNAEERDLADKTHSRNKVYDRFMQSVIEGERANIARTENQFGAALTPDDKALRMMTRTCRIDGIFAKDGNDFDSEGLECLITDSCERN